MNKFVSKLLMNGIVFVPLVMWLSNASFWGSVFAAIGLVVVAYLIGDQLLLRLTNNMVATIADACMTFFYLWLVARFADWTLSLGEIFIISIAVGIVEIIFHRQLGWSDGRRTIA
jgi:hypothetical protein